MKKILIIDNDAEIQNHTTEILQLANYKVLNTGNGKTGIEIAVKQQPDLILCSIALQEMNGYEVLYFLSKNILTANIPFVFLTKKKEVTDVRKGMNMGADDYLFKPFDKMELLTCIETRLRKSARFQRGELGKNFEELSEFLGVEDGVDKLQKVLEDKAVRRIAKKEVIYREGEIASSVLFVLKGKVKTYFNNEGGKEFITGISQEGEFVGMVDLISGELYRESAMAAENSEIILIPRKEVFTQFLSHHDLAVRIIHLLSKGTLELRERLFHIAYNSVRKRTANTLLSLLKLSSNGADQQRVSISRDDLASVIGITPESVSRTLHDFKEEKLIAFKNKSSEIVILNREELFAMKN